MSEPNKLLSVGKMAVGAARIASGIATATGHGLVGAYCRNHHMMAMASRIAKSSCEGGAKMFKEGARELGLD